MTYVNVDVTRGFLSPIESRVYIKPLRRGTSRAQKALGRIYIGYIGLSHSQHFKMSDEIKTSPPSPDGKLTRDSAPASVGTPATELSESEDLVRPP